MLCILYFRSLVSDEPEYFEFLPKVDYYNWTNFSVIFSKTLLVSFCEGQSIGEFT